MGEHAGFHFVAATFSALLLFTSLWKLPAFPTGWIATGPRLVLLGGLALLSGGQTIEGMGALFTSATIHWIGVWTSGAGTAITIPGVALTMIVLVAMRLNKLDSPWVLVAFAVATVSAVAFVVGSLVFGY